MGIIQGICEVDFPLAKVARASMPAGAMDNFPLYGENSVEIERTRAPLHAPP